MSDLENMWDDYPTGKAPVEAILSQAGARSPHGPARRHRLVTRPLLTAAAATALIGAFVTGTLVAGGDGPGDGAPPTGDLPQRVAFQADLEPAASCDDLLATYVERALPLVSAWGWGGASYGRAMFYDGPVALSGQAARDTASASEKAPAPQTSRQVNSATGTNVQEAAVDEPDTVKTDGELLLTVRDDELTTYDVSGSSTEELSSLSLPGIEDAEILLAGDTVVAIGSDDRATDDRYEDLYLRPAGTRVLGISVADPTTPEITSDVRYDAALVSARQHGSDVRIVLSSGLPDLDFVQPSGRRSEQKALRANRTLVEESTIEDWLPTITDESDGAEGDAAELLDCTNVAIPSDDLTIDTTSVVGFDAGEPGTVDAIGLAGQVGIAYESADHLYLAADGGGWGWAGPAARCVDWCDPIGGPGSGVSHVFDFELDGVAATHVASGEIEGSIRDRWSIDEADGVLRLAVGPTTETGNFNSVVTLERSGQRLVERGRLDGLGRNEDIKSVRWFDDLAVVVTFRQVDPLYAVDLTDTATPRLLGKLKVPGFSSYLHPLGDMRMIGVGEGPDGKGRWGAQLALFNVTDVTDVRRLAVHHYPRNTQAVAATDPRAFTWLPDQRTVLTVIEKWGSRRVGYLSIVKIVEGELRERLLQVDYGDDVDDIRAVPMPDGRVVLVTGDKAQFLEL